MGPARSFGAGLWLCFALLVLRGGEAAQKKISNYQTWEIYQEYQDSRFKIYNRPEKMLLEENSFNTVLLLEDSNPVFFRRNLIWGFKITIRIRQSRFKISFLNLHDSRSGFVFELNKFPNLLIPLKGPISPIKPFKGPSSGQHILNKSLQAVALSFENKVLLLRYEQWKKL